MIYSDISKILSQLTSINLVFIPIILLIHIVAVLIRAFRQKLLLDRLGMRISYRNNIRFHFAGFSLVFTPGGSGEMLKSYYLNNEYGYKYSQTIPVFLSEKYYDLLGAISVLAIVSCFRNFLVTDILILIIIPILITLYLSIKHQKIFKFLLSVTSRFPILKKGVNFIDDSHESLIQLLDKQTMMNSSLLSMISVFLEAFAFYLGFLAFGLHLSYVDATLITYTATTIGAISFLPGGMIITETGMTGILIKYGLSLSQSLSLVVFTRLTSIWFYTFIGFLSTKFVSHKRLAREDR